MAKWLTEWLRSQRGFVLLPGFDRDEGDDGGTVVDIDNIDDEGGTDDGGFDPRTGEGADDYTDEGDDEQPPEITDEAVLEYLKQKGVEFENIDNLKNLKTNLSGVSRQHAGATDTIKALRTALGQDQYDALLAQGMRKIATGDEGSGTDFGRDVQEPPHFSRLNAEQKTQLESTYDYFMQKSLPQVTQSIINGVMRYLDDREYQKEEKSFAGENPDYETYKDAMQEYRDKHGITGRSRDTMAWLLEQVKAEAGKAAKDLAGNETRTRRKVGTPPPKSFHRGAPSKGELKTDADFEAEFERMKAAEAKNR